MSRSRSVTVLLSALKYAQVGIHAQGNRRRCRWDAPDRREVSRGCHKARFLTIKLHILAVRPQLVSRSRLVERLNAGTAGNPLLLTSR